VRAAARHSHDRYDQEPALDEKMASRKRGPNLRGIAMDQPAAGFVWHELMTTDVGGAQTFNREVTGLTATEGPY
jgi:hypothetical protein